MGQAKIRQRMAFAPQLIEEWECDDCVNFAVALSRQTGWLLHVDWWTTGDRYRDDISDDLLKPLRVYVGDNQDRIFDARGIKTFVEFTEGTIVKLAREVAAGPGGVLTRFYDEAKLSSLPLRKQPDEVKIGLAIDAIRQNHSYLAAMPSRTTPCIPAYPAAKFTFGKCAAFAEAMHELTGLPAVAILAVRFSPIFEGTQRSERGYFHSVVLHPDGMAEDSWGKAPLKEIAGRFGVIEFKISSDEHRSVVETIQKNSADIYESALQSAIELIRAHRLSPAEL